MKRPMKRRRAGWLGSTRPAGHFIAAVVGPGVLLPAAGLLLFDLAVFLGALAVAAVVLLLVAVVALHGDVLVAAVLALGLGLAQRVEPLVLVVAPLVDLLLFLLRFQVVECADPVTLGAGALL